MSNFHLIWFATKDFNKTNLQQLELCGQLVLKGQDHKVVVLRDGDHKWPGEGFTGSLFPWNHIQFSPAIFKNCGLNAEQMMYSVTTVTAAPATHL